MEGEVPCLGAVREETCDCFQERTFSDSAGAAEEEEFALVQGEGEGEEEGAREGGGGGAGGGEVEGEVGEV